MSYPDHVWDVGTGNREDLLDIITNIDPEEETDTMNYPNATFDPHDPHHVTLQLLQEVHSQRISMQIDRDKQRAINHQQIGQVASYRNDLRMKQEEITGLELTLKTCKAALEEISQGRNKGAVKAREALHFIIVNGHKWLADTLCNQEGPS